MGGSLLAPGLPVVQSVPLFLRITGLGTGARKGLQTKSLCFYEHNGRLNFFFLSIPHIFSSVILTIL